MKKILLFFLAMFAWLAAVMAQAALPDSSAFSQGLKNTAETGAGYGSFTDAGLTMAKITGSVFTPAFVGVAGMLFLFYGGYTWMMSRGNEQEVTRAKTIITNTLIAMVFVFLAWVIVKLIMPLWIKVTT